jgi:hypothetical protein
MSNSRTFGLFAVAFATLLFTCTNEQFGPTEPDPPSGTSRLPANPQVITGNAPKGWDYLREGNFIGGGVPWEIYSAFPGNLSNENLLNRSGDNAKLPPGFNVFTMPSGVKVAGGITCFGCHSAKVNGQFVAGLGNSLMDFTQDNSQLFNLVEFGIRGRYGESSPEWKAFEPYARGAKAAAPYTILPFNGINPAFMLEQASVAHRQANLNWNGGQTVFPIPKTVIGSDVPPLWNVKKKRALYYNGMGRGDFTKLLMQVTVVAVEDTFTARNINNNFKDVMAWLQTLAAPKYPGTINATLAQQGKVLFQENCESCHGKYGADDYYPNLLVELDKVGTDPVYARYFVENPGFTNWYNLSWYGQSSPKSQAIPSLGYVAPPLDGIWASAPYLHNGSVPTLDDLLNSPQRPNFWRRSFSDQDYDFEKVGWKYSSESSAKDKQTYNSSLSGYGNQGHRFGDKFSVEQRKSVVEYLKGL